MLRRHTGKGNSRHQADKSTKMTGNKRKKKYSNTDFDPCSNPGSGTLFNHRNAKHKLKRLVLWSQKVAKFHPGLAHPGREMKRKN